MPLPCRCVCAGKDPNAGDVEEEEDEDEALPDFRPHWVSPAAWLKLVVHFKTPGTDYDPTWLKCHFRPCGYEEKWYAWYESVMSDREGSLRRSREEFRRLSFNEGTAPPGTRGSARGASIAGAPGGKPGYMSGGAALLAPLVAKEPEWSIPPPAISSLYVRANDLIVFCQLHAISTGLSGFIIFCIILAGILVGVQSYPEMDGNPTLAVMDLAVQIVFTCVALTIETATGATVF